VVAVATKAANGADPSAAEAYPCGTATLEETRQALVGNLARTSPPPWAGSHRRRGHRAVLLTWAARSASSSACAHHLARPRRARGEEIHRRRCDADSAMAPQTLHLTATEVPEGVTAKQAEIFEAQMRDMEKAPPKSMAQDPLGQMQKW